MSQMKSSEGQLYMTASRLENCKNTKYEQKMPPPPIEIPCMSGAQTVFLPEPDLLPDQQVNFLELVELRATTRMYSKVLLTMKELSYMLWCTQGVKMGLPGNGTMRTVPSAGARHALETYLYIRNVESLQPGIYRFLAMEHVLTPIDTSEDVQERILRGFKAVNMVKASAVTFIWTAALERMDYMFGERAYRYLFIDAGHVCQNLYLSAYTIHTGVCAVGAFYDDVLNEALGLDGEKTFAVYAATVGKIEE
jgi:SagB-type dehydrogenase family enzyme